MLVGLIDAWLAVLIPGLLMIPIGMLFAGAFGSAVVTAFACLIFLLAVASLSSCCGSAAALLFRDRRRADVATLVVALVLTLGGLVPVAFTGDSDVAPEAAPTETEELVADEVTVPETEAGQTGNEELGALDSWLDEALPGFVRFLPSELCAAAAVASVEGPPMHVVTATLGLLAWLGALYWLSWLLYRRLLTEPAQERGRDVGARGELALFRLPGLDPTSAATAWATTRSVLRTVRGKMAMAMNFLLLGVMYLMLRTNIGESLWQETGVLLALAGFALCLLSLQTVMYNHFAIDGHGLTLELLAPIGVRSLVRGKLFAGALLVSCSFALCVIAALVLSPSGHPFLWLALLPAAISGYALYGPIGLLFSALFPRTADLSQLGSGGNPHSLSGFVATLLSPLCLAPAILLGFLGQLVFSSALLTLVLVSVWMVIALGIAVLIERLAVDAVERRAENLQLIATGHS